ncbi:hypothetical protein [Microbacterium paraoxydans]|uniref:hypothetical protein n=1 Tax=Microbacterium paraoxydans TaxID=199592 RepID=UPI003D739000
MGTFKGFGKRNTYELSVRMKRRKNGKWVAKVYDEIMNEEFDFVGDDPITPILQATHFIEQEFAEHIEFMAGVDQRPPQDR